MTTRLSSDILEEQFGPTAVKILHQDEAIRIIQTRVIETGQILELSLVRFDPVGVAAFPEVHLYIVGGESVGKAFRTRGINFRREEAFAVRQALPAPLHQLFGADDATIVATKVLVGPDAVCYATITELFAGEVEWPRHFGDITQAALKDVQYLSQLLETKKLPTRRS